VALTPLEQRDLTIKAVGVLVFSLMVFTAACKLVRYCFTVKKPEPVLSLTLENGVTLIGTRDEQDRLQGEGTKEYSNTFEVKKETGEFKDSVLIKGTREFYNGDVHEGTFQTGKLVQGTITFADKTVWTGDFKGGKLHGEGKQDLSQCLPPSDKKNEVVIREGQFVEGTLHGEGKKIFGGGQVHQGKFNQNFLIQGKILCDGGDFYDGTFDTEFNLQGQGTKSIGGIIYEGIFKDDQLIQGTIKSPDGSVREIRETA
jgi:hypothetical protein